MYIYLFTFISRMEIIVYSKYKGNAGLQDSCILEAKKKNNIFEDEEKINVKLYSISAHKALHQFAFEIPTQCRLLF